MICVNFTDISDINVDDGMLYVTETTSAVVKEYSLADDKTRTNLRKIMAAMELRMAEYRKMAEGYI